MSHKRGACHNEVLDPHDVMLQPDCDEAVDVLRDGHKDFPCHVAAFLRAWGLVLNPCGTLLNEHLGELEHGCEASMAGVCVGDNWAEVIDVRSFGCDFWSEIGARFALFLVMEELSLEEVFDFVRDGVGRIV